MAWRILAGLAIAAVLSLLVILRAGMLLRVIVGFANQRFGKPAGDVPRRDKFPWFRIVGRNHQSFKGGER